MTATLLSVFATFAVGGPQVRFATLANRFGSRYRHLIVAMDGATQARELLDTAIDVDFPQLVISHGRTLANIPRFRRTLVSLRPDALVTHNWGSMDWALANLGTVVRHVHIEDGFGPEERDRQLARRVLIRRTVLRRSTVVVPSRTLERIAIQTWRLPRNRVRYIPNGVSLDRFAAKADRAAEARQGVVVGTAAALRPEKRLDRLLRAFSAIPETGSGTPPPSLRIAGDGPERGPLERLARELGIADRVALVGHLNDPAPFYAALDIVALSSDTEQMPLSIIEAMAAGLPVAATDVGDVRIMVAPENRAFVVPREDAMLAGALGTLVADAGLRARLGAANREKARGDYDQESMFAAYGALFDGTGGGGPASQARSA